MNDIIKLIDVDNFDNLVAQINKDVKLAGIDSDLFNKVVFPTDLVDKLKTFIDALISNYQESFNNFMYRVDVSEKDVNQMNKGELGNLVDQITYFVIKREMQKVFFRKQFSQK